MTAPFLDRAARAAVVARLDQVRHDHGVAIPLAVESGSRAWGFPSPDSDYDCRFIYVRPARDYLDPWPPRDVIETPLDAVLDVNGWDLVKAVRLAVKGNATVAEWVSSPLVYTAADGFRDDLVRLVHEIGDRSSLVQHYAHVAAHQRDQWRSGGEVSLKRVFYALRPAAVLRWLRTHPDEVVAPIGLDTLLTEGEAEVAVTDAAEELTRLKSHTRELGSGVVPMALWRFIDDELARVAPATSRTDLDEVRAVAAEWFRSAVGRYGPP